MSATATEPTATSTTTAPAPAPGTSASSATGSPSTGLHALVVGATGQVGRHVLTALLADDAFSTVHEYGRRTTADLTHAKLTQKSIDFEALKPGEFGEGGGFDVVFITLGTTRANAGSASAFEKIDREYVIKAAEAAQLKEGGKTQHLLYCSSSGASPTSPLLYPRSKGLTELGLARLGYSTTTLFRPGFLADAQRGERRLLEGAFGVLTGALSRFSSSVEIPVETLGKAMVRVGAMRGTGQALPVGKEETIIGPKVKGAAAEGEEGRAWVVGNADALELAKGA